MGIALVLSMSIASAGYLFIYFFSMPVDVQLVPLDFNLQPDAKIPSLRTIVSVGPSF
jgi:hypothetical protein